MYATGDKDILLVNSKKCAPAGTRHSATITIVNRRRDLSSTTFSRDEMRSPQSTSALKTRRAVIYPDCRSNRPQRCVQHDVLANGKAAPAARSGQLFKRLLPHGPPRQPRGLLPGVQH